jgi:hypothetical protein
MVSRWNKNRLSDPHHPNWNAHSPAVKQLLGLEPTQKLPKEGMSARIVEGIKIWVTPYIPTMSINRWTGKTVLVKTSKHRVMGQCPQCNREMSAGRLFQHVCTGTKQQKLDIREL